MSGLEGEHDIPSGADGPTEENSVRSRKHPPYERNFSENEFKCGCCFELMVKPTTLSCGHSFCRLCLVKWYYQIKKLQCPLCKQVWTECPNVNVTLRNLIDKSFTEAVNERSQILYIPENAKLLERFEKEKDQRSIQQPAVRNVFQRNHRNQPNQPNPVRDFCVGVLVIVCVMAFVYLLWYWRSGSDDLLIHKSPLLWSEDEVCQWLSGLGQWAEPYCDSTKKNQLNGRLLLALDQESLKETMGVSYPLHLRAMYNSLLILKEQGLKLPTTLWEYKALHPKISLILLHGMKDFPRSLMLYLYFFEYEEIFLPFLHTAYPNTTEEEDLAFTHLFDQPNISQLIEFVPLFLVLPYWSVVRLTYGWLDKHYWISRLVVVNCLLLTIIEVMTLRYFIQNNTDRWMMFKIYMKKHVKNLLSTAVFVVVWPMVPSFICDIFFYFTLFFSSFLNLDKIRKGIEI